MKEKILNLLKNNWRLIFEIILVFLLLFSTYSYITKPTQSSDTNKKIVTINEKIDKKQELLISIQKSIDSVKSEQKTMSQKINRTLITINKIERKRDEKTAYIYRATTDSVVSYLSTRYNKTSIP